MADEATPKTTVETSEPDEPLVSVQIQNPFKKLLHWLNDIRKKQTTTFDFKIKIPLLALPIFFAVLGGTFQFFFNLGQAKEQQVVAAMPTPTPIIILQPTSTPAPVLVSRMGIIKATYQVQNLISPSPLPSPTVMLSESETSPSATIEPFIEPSPTPTPVPTRYVLVNGQSITFLIVPPEVSLNYYLNKRVLISGLFNKTTDTLQVSRTQDIEILP